MLQAEAPPNGWRQVLPALGSDLESLGKSTEGEFLSIGEKLQDFYQRAGDISKISSTVARLMSGEELGAAIEGFRSVVDRMKRLEGESRRNAKTLQDVLENLARLNHHVDGFGKTIRHLRVLGVSTRIESARLGDHNADFETLADEVGKLSLEIENRCFQLLGSSDSLSQLIGQTLAKVLDLETAQQTQATIVFDKTMSSLESLMERHGLSAAGAGNISTRYEAVSQRIGGIVSSMQFHDITRQRIEHVQQALAGLEPSEGNGARRKAGEFLSGFGRMRPKGTGENLRLAGDVCDLQIAQLHYAREELVSAVNNILDNLSAMSDLVAEMARETFKMAGAADETGQSFLNGVEAGFSSVASAIEAYSEANRELSLATGSVGSMLGQMSAHTGNIEAIGEKIKLIALNAIIKVCHIGEEGVALGVLAEAVHQLSVETRQRTETASESLRFITSASESLCAAVNADGKDKGCELASVGETLRTQLQALQKVNQGIVSLLKQMNLDGCSLSGDIRKTIDEVHVHHRVDQVIGNVVSGLVEIVAYSRSKGPAEDQADRAQRMEALEATYTMQGEREVHHTVFELKTNPGPDGDAVTPLMAAGMENEKTGSEPDKADQEDLGDNFELF
jgi:methyl-accepting chemotaxis protein